MKTYLTLFLTIVLTISCQNDSNSNEIVQEDENIENPDNPIINIDSFVIDGGRTCNNTPTEQSIFNMEENGELTNITFNYIPIHKTAGLPKANQRTFQIPTNPEISESITPVANTEFTGSSGHLAYIFGIGITGVPFDPVANEPWINVNTGTKNYNWNLEVLSTNVDLTYDCNNAHGIDRYHYHGSPLQYLGTVESENEHSNLLGYAADGFPIYYKYGYSDPNDTNSSIIALVSSYSLKEGLRPGDGVSAPGNAYDGTYAADYEYDENTGDLDECNGRWTKTPDYPNGTYAYFVTDEFPSIPRNFRGTPSEDFKIGN